MEVLEESKRAFYYNMHIKSFIELKLRSKKNEQIKNRLIKIKNILPKK